MNVIIKYILPVFAILALLSLAAWMANYFENRVEPGMTAPIVISEDIEYHLVQRSTRTTTESLPATIRAKQQTVISSRIIARINHIKVRAGDIVRRGDLLIDLEKEALVSRAERENENVKATEALQNEALNSLNRTREMYEKKLVAIAELDAVQADYNSLSARLESVRQAYSEALTTVGYTRIISPIDGRVIDRFAEPGDTASPGEKLLSIYNPGSLRVEAQVREQLALSLSLGQVIEATVPSLNTTVEAFIEELVPAANPGARSFLVKASIPYQEKLLPGMFVQLNIKSGQQRQIYIPKNYITNVGQLNIVWVKGKDGMERRIIRVGTEANNGDVLVLSGLSEGEELAIISTFPAT
jgi:RND family efflux transporter MFP subunit